MSCWSAHKSLLWRYLHRSLFLRFILERKAGIGGVICCALPVGLIFMFFFGGISGAISTVLSDKSRRSGERDVASRKAPHPEGLIYKENIIKRRISELSEREQKVKAVLDRAKQSSGEKWQQVRETLSASIQTLKRQHASLSIVPNP